MTAPGVTNHIEVDLTAGGDPKISISDGSTTQNYVRYGSSSSVTQIPSGGYAVYTIHSDPSNAKTVYINPIIAGVHHSITYMTDRDKEVSILPFSVPALHQPVLQ